MATVYIKIDTKSLECSLCLETVSDPRILPCGHTFCGLKSPRKCLQRLDPRNAGAIKCPNCLTDHHVRAANVPPDIKCREMLESLNSNEQDKRMCHKHNKKIVMRCKVDGELVCLSCIAGDHSGHQVEEVHKQERTQLVDYWNKENANFDNMQLICRGRKKLLRRDAEYLANQLKQEDFLDYQLGKLITRRVAITLKLASDDFNPEDEDVMALKAFMDHLKATSESQHGASHDVRVRSQDLVELVDSRTPTYCQNIIMNPEPATTRPIPPPKVINRPSKGPTDAEQTPTASAGISTSRQDVRRRTLPKQNFSCSSNILALGDRGRNYILAWNGNSWKQWKGKRADFRWGFGIICHKGKVYIMGGYRDPTEASPKVYIFDIRENKWTEGPELNNRRENSSACFVESQRSIYICGGTESGLSKYALASVEKLEIDENGSPVGAWREVTPMKEKRMGCAAVAVGTQLFVMGGKNANDEILSSVEVFNTVTEEWIDGPQMKQCRADHTCEHYDGSIYAMGGCVDVSSVISCIQSCEKLDLQSWTWTPIESMSVLRYRSGSVVPNGKIYVVGGLTKGNKEDKRSVEIYDPVTNTWYKGPQLPKSLGDTKCVCW